ncbi:unnamed protein product [Cyprideis torosa]|uniref:Uncharacterized protein n=1 Tax=Cyprideis torosa TaxID=163714 RepID=A0A7R8WBU6_9CRUS|nr:unnamed protein product [Cyprideis torosa]CAG0890008.1 unnamed protein product [Cyprideis torosa]
MMDFPVLFFVFGFISLSYCGPHSPESRAFCTDCELCSGTFSTCEAQCAANDQFPIRLMEESDMFWVCTSPLELGSECTEDGECQLSVPSSVCRNGKCACKPGTVRVNQTLCIQPGNGEMCPKYVACNDFILNSVCDKETWTCRCGVHMAPDLNNVCVNGCLEGGVVNLSTNKCYYLKTITPGTRWIDARDSCRADGMHLVSIHSATENTFVHDLAGISWIGLNDLATEGEFVWSDGTPTNYANWKPSEPNNYNGGQ